MWLALLSLVRAPCSSLSSVRGDDGGPTRDQIGGPYPFRRSLSPAHRAGRRARAESAGWVRTAAAVTTPAVSPATTATAPAVDQPCAIATSPKATSQAAVAPTARPNRAGEPASRCADRLVVVAMGSLPLRPQVPARLSPPPRRSRVPGPSNVGTCRRPRFPPRG